MNTIIAEAALPHHRHPASSIQHPTSNIQHPKTKDRRYFARLPAKPAVTRSEQRALDGQTDLVKKEQNSSVRRQPVNRPLARNGA